MCWGLGEMVLRLEREPTLMSFEKLRDLREIVLGVERELTLMAFLVLEPKGNRAESRARAHF